jgi:uncharacterized protein with HEPN domain
MNERDESLLLNIKDDAELLLELTDGYDFEHFLDDARTKLAVSMLLIKVGEFVKSLSEDLKQSYSTVRWGSITNLRNIAAHNYNGLRMDDIWGIVTRDIPELLKQVKGILRDGGVEDG